MNKLGGNSKKINKRPSEAFPDLLVMVTDQKVKDRADHFFGFFQGPTGPTIFRRSRLSRADEGGPTDAHYQNSNNGPTCTIINTSNHSKMIHTSDMSDVANPSGIRDQDSLYLTFENFESYCT